jgi:hypothetical protein
MRSNRGHLRASLESIIRPFGNKRGGAGKALLIIVLGLLIIVGSAVAGGFYFLNNGDPGPIGDLLNMDKLTGSGLGKAEFKEVLPEELKETAQWGTIPLNQIVVVLKDDQKPKLAQEIATSLSGGIVGEMTYINLYQIAFAPLDEVTFNAKLSEIQGREGVETAFPNALVISKVLKGTPCSPLSDPVFGSEENRRAYEMIGMLDAWRIIKASKVKLNNVKVGVLDDALYTGSDETGGKVKFEGDSTGDPEKDDLGNVVDGGLNHGTMVTHVIGADPDNSGVTGVASILKDKLTINVKNLYDGVQLPVPPGATANDLTIGVDTSGATHTLKALVYLQKQVESGAKVINCSYGAEKPEADNAWINAAYQKFFNKMAADHPDVVFVAAAGNEGRVDGAITSSNYFPGGIPSPNVITVGALNNDGTKAGFSNFASGDGEVTLSAPGSKVVMGVDVNGNPIKSSGTSFAAPQVTATIALLQSINPKLSAAELKAYITGSANPGTTNKDQSIPIPAGMGAGLLRVDLAVLAVINDVRASEGKDPLTAESLMNLSKVELTAKGGGKKFIVTAVLPEVADGTTPVTISVNGQHIMSGNSTQSLGTMDEATWEIEIVDPSVFIKVTREDTETCATMNLMEGDFSGKWDTTLTITEDTLLVVIFEAISAMLDDMAAENGCEKTENGDYKIIGMTSLAYFDITKLDDEGTLYSITSTPQDPEADGLDLSEFLNNLEGEVTEEGQLVFNFVKSEDGVTMHFDVTLSIVDEKTLSGNFKLYLEGAAEGMAFNASMYTLGSIAAVKIE